MWEGNIIHFHGKIIPAVGSQPAPDIAVALPSHPHFYNQHGQVFGADAVAEKITGHKLIISRCKNNATRNLPVLLINLCGNKK